MAVVLALALSATTFGSDGAPDALAPAETWVTDAADAPSLEPAYRPIWDRLAMCESTQNWHIASGNGYFGGLQMDMVFWRRHGGLAYASRPDRASREAQIAVAEVGLAVQGWSAWPACSRRLGLR